MKTIEEAAELWAKDQKEIRLFGQRVSISRSTEDFQVDAFIAGVEFAQRWISVEDELPEKYYTPIIVKDKNNNWDKAYLSGLGWCFENEETRLKKPTHWRPINLK